MTICPDCSIDFHLLDAGELCQKCKMLSSLTSEVDKSVVRDKAHCKSCSLVYAQLRQPLCHTCCTIFGLPRNENRAQNPSLLKASAARLTVGTRGVGTGVSSKGQDYLQELKEKRDIGSKVRILVSMAKSVPKKGGQSSSFLVIQEVRFQHLVNDDDMIDPVLDQVVLQVQKFHAESFPLAPKIYRTMVTFYAFVSATNNLRLDTTTTTQGTALNFLLHFKSQGFVSKAQFDVKTLSLRVIVNSDQGGLSLSSAAVSSARPSSSSKTRASTSSQKSAAAGDTVRASKALNVRRSAYVPHRITPAPPKFSRNPPMVSFKFRRYEITVNGARVEISRECNTTVEYIEIAGDWEFGLRKSKKGEAFQDTGYLGTGSAKQVIYARIGDLEYAFAQSADPDYSVHSHHTMLSEELHYLHFGEAVRTEFVSLASEYNMNLPQFRFNAEGAILGFLEPVEQSSTQNMQLPHRNFLATRLLPCGPVDKPIHKFTGNHDCGGAPKDPMTMVLHAFSHFVPVFTNNDSILCDLQGMYDRNKVMVLIDPQMHTAETNKDKRMYWDNGPKAIKDFMEHHLQVCDDNTICVSLELQTQKYETTIPEDRASTPPSSSRRTRSRSRSLSVSPYRKRVNTGSQIHAVIVKSSANDKSSTHVYQCKVSERQLRTLCETRIRAHTGYAALYTRGTQHRSDTGQPPPHSLRVVLSIISTPTPTAGATTSMGSSSA
ncbi:hypothetical protein C8R43DRAFT_1232520 [Mycena crocata]|nr:hypothetical protein C8R43DRAFT_1232520 [Mycena crocata]